MSYTFPINYFTSHLPYCSLVPLQQLISTWSLPQYLQFTYALRIHNFSSVTTHSFYYYNFPWWAKVIALLECFVTSDLLCLLRIPPVVVSLSKLLPSVYILSVIRYPHSLSSCLRGCSIVVAMAPRVQIIRLLDYFSNLLLLVRSVVVEDTNSFRYFIPSRWTLTFASHLPWVISPLQIRYSCPCS